MLQTVAKTIHQMHFHRTAECPWKCQSELVAIFWFCSCWILKNL